jgi:hypothetical protein
MQTYRGSCHCGAILFEIETDFPELTTCDCSICRRKNALMVKVHEDQFKLLSGDQSLSEYRFHTKTRVTSFARAAAFILFTVSESHPTISVSMCFALTTSTHSALPSAKRPAPR